jgi:hypothetical protein
MVFDRNSEQNTPADLKRRFSGVFYFHSTDSDLPMGINPSRLTGQLLRASGKPCPQSQPKQIQLSYCIFKQRGLILESNKG